MNDIFQEVKKRVKILDVCNLLNIKLNRSNMCLCMFHKENTPSFSVSPSKNIFYCFGCGKKGDVITLVSEILNIQPFEAVKFINSHLGLGLDIEKNKKYDFNTYRSVKKYEEEKKSKEKYELWKKQTFSDLCDYLHMLENKYEKKCKEFNNIEKVDDFFNDEDINKYCNEIDIIQYYIDFFIYGEEKDILWLKNTKKGKVVNYNGRRIRPRNS